MQYSLMIRTDGGDSGARDENHGRGTPTFHLGWGKLLCWRLAVHILLGVLNFSISIPSGAINADVEICPWWVIAHSCCLRTNTCDLNKSHILRNETTTWCHGNLNSSGKLRRMRAIRSQSGFSVRARQMRSSTKELTINTQFGLELGLLSPISQWVILRARRINFTRRLLRQSEMPRLLLSLLFGGEYCLKLCRNPICQG